MDNTAKISSDDFMYHTKFTYGVPLIFLDCIDYLTGSDFITQIESFRYPPRLEPQFESTSKEFEATKKKIQEDFLPCAHDLFQKLGAIDFSKLE